MSQKKKKEKMKWSIGKKKQTLRTTGLNELNTQDIFTKSKFVR